MRLNRVVISTPIASAVACQVAPPSRIFLAASTSASVIVQRTRGFLIADEPAHIAALVEHFPRDKVWHAELGADFLVSRPGLAHGERLDYQLLEPLIL